MQDRDKALRNPELDRLLGPAPPSMGSAYLAPPPLALQPQPQVRLLA